MSEAPQRLAEDPAYAADIAAVKAARPDAAVLARVERRLAQGEAPAPRPRLRFVLVLGVLVSAVGGGLLWGGGAGPNPWPPGRRGSGRRLLGGRHSRSYRR